MKTMTLEQIRSKSAMKLTSKEIARLTRREQRWVLAYRAEQRVKLAA